MRNGKTAISRSFTREIVFVLFCLSWSGLFAFESPAQVKRNGPISYSACGNSPDALSKLVFVEYGAMFAAAESVTLPTRCVFVSEQQVEKFQGSLDTSSIVVAGVEIELQTEAAAALQKAIETANSRGLRITPLDGKIAGKRSFADTERIWNSRFLPALNYWVRRGKITATEADSARTLSVVDQVTRVLEWEAQGILFSTGKNRPIMSSVAPPGTSQHLSLIAFDIEQASNRAVRQIMNSNGWYQTVSNDSPHFTYLGLAESELPKRGLKAVNKGGYTYWVPAL